jgi:hypothetical protein
MNEPNDRFDEARFASEHGAEIDDRRITERRGEGGR